ncbi:MAG: hypothetical protein K2N03_06510 [Muribaculaceae bacterium]|nr:hypothetical protein [Muribaculaceae bacterium]
MGKGWTGNERAPWHDYTKRQIYHITLKKRREVIPFGSLAGNPQLPMNAIGRSYIKASSLGAIIKDSLRQFQTIFPAIRIFQYALMPDHLHILISVETPLDEILGRKLAIFKVMVNKRANIESVFEKGFNDQILTATRSLNVIFDYLRDNPYRLAVRYACPHFFSRVNRIKIGDSEYDTYGNFQLLKNPFKEQVVVHRADSLQTKAENRARWLHMAANGGVLVSPFISKAEKDIRA